MTRECIPILFKLNSRNHNHSFNLAPSISYSGGGGGATILNRPSNYGHCYRARLGQITIAPVLVVLIR